ARRGGGRGAGGWGRKGGDGGPRRRRRGRGSHIAWRPAPATTPRIEKMPAPTMPPIPMHTAATMPICAEPALAPGAFEDSVEFIGKLACLDEGSAFLFAIHIPLPA